MKPRLLPSALATFALVAGAHTAHAYRVLEQYDVDSLVYLSTAIVRAQVTTVDPASTHAGNVSVFRANVLASFKGNARPGQTLRVTGLEEYHRRTDQADSWPTLQPGDIIYLFLQPDAKAPTAHYQQAGTDGNVVHSGVRLLAGDDVYAFAQYVPRGPQPQVGAPVADYILRTPALFPGAPVLTRTAFEDRLTGSIQANDRLAATLDTQPTPTSTAAALDLLKQRTALVRAEMATTDRIGELLIQRQLQNASPAALEALHEDAALTRDERIQVEWALATAPARDYFLARVADPAEPMPRRLHMAAHLAAAGHQYTMDARAPGAATTFATRLAQLAVAQLNTPLAEPLLRGVAGCSDGPSDDVDAAAAILSNALATAQAGVALNVAEALQKISPQRYRQALPHAGPYALYIAPAPDLAAGLKAREIRATGRFGTGFPSGRGSPPNRGVLLERFTLILQPAAGGPTIEIPSAPHFTTGPGPANTFSLAESLPPTLAPGRYHAFLRVTLTNSFDGFGFDLDVP